MYVLVVTVTSPLDRATSAYLPLDTTCEVRRTRAKLGYLRFCIHFVLFSCGNAVPSALFVYAYRNKHPVTRSPAV